MNNMKKYFSMMLVLASFLGLASCANDEIYTPQEVGLTLDYTFAESGSMTRAAGEEVYGSFYEKYIKTKKLTPTTYSLIFTNGVWGNKDAIRLMEGEYTVAGTSAPQPIEDEMLSHHISDTVFISFDETVHISKDMTSITLTAKYDSYLLMFDKDNCNEAYYHVYLNGRNNRKNLYETNNNYILLPLFYENQMVNK